MARILHLAFETPPHPHAVCAAVDEIDARFVLELLAMPRAQRQRFAVQFCNYLQRTAARSSVIDDTLVCRAPGGTCHFIPRRLAKWLSHVLPAEESVIARTAERIRHWLKNGETPSVIRPQTAARNGPPIG